MMMTRKYIKILGILILSFFLVAPFMVQAIERVSITDLGVEGNNSSGDVSISSDGRYVAFESWATNLVAGDTNGTLDVFVYDRDTDIIERVSVTDLGVEGDSSSYFPSISSDGRYVSFYSGATNLVAGDTNNNSDVFVYDRTTDTIERVSVADGGIQSNAQSIYPSISGDGRYVTFYSQASNLVAGDTNGANDIFVYDRDTDIIERVSVTDLGVEGDSSSYFPSISSDGRYVSFESLTTNLVAGDTNGQRDVFVYDRDTDTIERVSVTDLGVEGDGFSYTSSISSDGRYVSFTSNATNLVTGDTNGVYDIFVYDRDTDTIERVSVTDLGVEGDFNSFSPSISEDGRYVSFESLTTNLVAGDINGVRDIFVYDRDTDTIERVSVTDLGVEGNGSSYGSSISGDGNYISFYSSATNLVSGDTNGVDDIFVVYIGPITIPTADSLNTTDTNPTLTGTWDETNAVTLTVLIDGTTYTYGTDPELTSTSGNWSLNLSNATPLVRGTTYEVVVTTNDNLINEASDITNNEIYIKVPSTGGGIHFSCKDENALNYERFGKHKESLCEYEVITEPPTIGCTDDTATNYDPEADIDNGSCEITTDPEDPEEPIEPEDPEEPIEPEEVCTDITANNYNVVGDCTYDIITTVFGCTDITADNYDQTLGVNVEDGSCIFLGCLDPIANNYDPTKNTDNGTCTYDETTIPITTEPPTVTPPGGGGVVPPITTGGGGGFIPETFPNIAIGSLIISALAVVLLNPELSLQVAVLPLRLWNLMPVLIGLRRRERPWGTVFDSVTKQPLDPVHVSLNDLQGNIIATSITDMDGRYGFLVQPGEYKITANKSNYKYPSIKMQGEDHDALYEHLYFGENITITKSDELILKNIPMDSISFNWNEFEKTKNKKLLKYYSKRELFLAKASVTIFVVGFTFSAVALYFNQNLLNTVIVGIYFLILALRILGVRPKKPGHVLDKEGVPLSYGIVRLFSAELGVEKGHVAIGETGKYYMLAPNGRYIAKIEKKTGENSYEEVFTSEPFNVSKGFLDRKFEV